MTAALLTTSGMVHGQLLSNAEKPFSPPVFVCKDVLRPNTDGEWAAEAEPPLF